MYSIFLYTVVSPHLLIALIETVFAPTFKFKSAVNTLVLTLYWCTIIALLSFTCKVPPCNCNTVALNLAFFAPTIAPGSLIVITAFGQYSGLYITITLSIDSPQALVAINNILFTPSTKVTFPVT